MTENNKQKGTLSKIWNTHNTAVKLLSFGGLLLTCCFLPTAAVAAQGGGLIGIGTEFYSSAFNAAATNFIPGWDIIFQETANTAAQAANFIMNP